MARRRKTPLDEYGVITVTHHAVMRERSEFFRHRPGPKPRRPECLIVGHAWTDDPARDGGSICMVCQVVRWP